ncbi:MAG: B12-binding domain-containing radical SAM protein, partial [Planctomycetota bacterium]
MRVALYVSREREGPVQTPPGLQYLAGYLVGEGLCEGEEILFAESAGEAIDFGPHVLGVGSVSQCLTDGVRVAEQVRAAVPECWTVLGGYHVSALPRSLPAGFDVGVVGEGEVTFAQLVSLRAEAERPLPELLGPVKGICFRDGGGSVVLTPGRPLIEDIDSLPPPLRRLPYGQQWPYLFTARGC